MNIYRLFVRYMCLGERNYFDTSDQFLFHEGKSEPVKNVKIISPATDIQVNTPTKFSAAVPVVIAIKEWKHSVNYFVFGKNAAKFYKNIHR